MSVSTSPASALIISSSWEAEHQKKTRRLLDAHFRVAPEERVSTEISRKFTPDQLYQLLETGGFALQSHYQSPNNYFSLVLARPNHSY